MRLQIDQKQKEVKAHGTYGFPVLVSPERLSWFDTGEFPWHWHPEIELTLILEGEILYQVNDNSCLLKAGEGLFCNTNVLHAGRHGNSADCSYLSVTFHPRLLYGYNNSLMQNRYMEGILRDPELASIHFKPEVDWQKKVLEQIRKIQRLSADKAEASELKIQIALMEIWLLIYEHVEPGAEEQSGQDRDTERIRCIMVYIQEHYAEKITLEELAEQIHLCRSESCRLFKRYMNASIFDYLLDYRVERSLPLLRDDRLDVTQIAGMTGFSNPAYFAKYSGERWDALRFSIGKSKEKRILDKEKAPGTGKLYRKLLS